MAYDLEEQEKLDALKDWWDRNSNWILAVVVVVAASILGWRGWQWYEGYQAQQAMGYFEALEQAAKQPIDDDDALMRLKAASQVLQNDYAKSAYTSRGLLLAASALQQRQSVDEAQDLLRWLISKDYDPVASAVARLRLAAIYLEEGKPQQGLDVLAKETSGFEGLYADRRGDLYYFQENYASARQQWKMALDYLADQPAAAIVQLKIDALSEE